VFLLLLSSTMEDGGILLPAPEVLGSLAKALKFFAEN
jgi:hypothetical protein